MNIQDATRLVAEPTTPPEVLAQIAENFPSLRHQVAAHPNAYPGLQKWIAGITDQQVAATPQPTGSKRSGWLHNKVNPLNGAQKWATTVPTGEAGYWERSSCLMTGSTMFACTFASDNPKALSTMIATFNLSDGHMVTKAMLSDLAFSGPMALSALAYADDSIIIQTAGTGDEENLASIGYIARVSEAYA